jgi:AraC family transcriptional regulator
MQSPFYPEGLSGFDTFDGYAGRIQIQELEDVLVIYERSIGNYIELKEKWVQFMNEYQDHLNENTLLIERFYDDPAITSLDSCIYDICMSTDESCGLENMNTIKGGKFAVYRFEGEIQNIFCSIQGIFSVWLPASGYIMDERYGMNIYRKIDRDNEYVIMDLCIPVK